MMKAVDSYILCGFIDLDGIQGNDDRYEGKYGLNALSRRMPIQGSPCIDNDCVENHEDTLLRNKEKNRKTKF
jgi:hypothetical protein